MPETTDCRAASALLIPLALQISKEAVYAGSTSGSTKVGACPKQSASGKRRGPVSGRNRGRRLGSHFSGLVGVEAWAPAADLPPFPDHLRRRAGAVERGSFECEGPFPRGAAAGPISLPSPSRRARTPPRT